MNIDIHAKGIELNPPLRAFIEEKMGDVERTIGSAGPASVRVEVGIPSHHHHKGEVFYAEANLDINGHLLRSEATGHDLHAAIVDVKDDLKAQVSRLKDRLREEERQPAEE